MSEAERMLQDIEGIWAAYGGIGQPPALVVSPALFAEAVKAGFPADRMRVAREMPVMRRPGQDRGWKR